MKEGRKPEYPEKTPGDELQKMPHTTARRFKPQARLEPAQQHWWQARKADTLTVTQHIPTKLNPHSLHHSWLALYTPWYLMLFCVGINKKKKHRFVLCICFPHHASRAH